ncbi:MAG: hypothetical protein WCO40_02825 [Thermoleophilia bacterium]
MNEVVRLAIGGPVAIGARASATLTDLLATSGITVAHTGSVVLDWPSQTLPFSASAWEALDTLEADPIAFAFHHLTARSTTGVWQNPVDAARALVGDWVAAERLRVTPPWPGGATCAIALVHEAQAIAPPRTGVLRKLRRSTPSNPFAAYTELAAIEKQYRATAALRSIDLLEPEQQARIRMLGFSLGAGVGIQIAGRPGFRRGTAFPSRGFDTAGDRPTDTIEFPLLDDAVSDGLAALLSVGGAAALSVPMERFSGEHGATELLLYDELLSRLESVGAWLTTPEAIAERLYA